MTWPLKYLGLEEFEHDGVEGYEFDGLREREPKAETTGTPDGGQSVAKLTHRARGLEPDRTPGSSRSRNPTEITEPGGVADLGITGSAPHSHVRPGDPVRQPGKSPISHNNDDKDALAAELQLAYAWRAALLDALAKDFRTVDQSWKWRRQLSIVDRQVRELEEALK